MKFLAAALTSLLVLPAIAGPATMPIRPPASTQPAATQPSSITLHLKGVNARAALDEFSRRAGVGLPLVADDLLDRNADAPVSLDVDRQPFWAALEALGQKTGLEPLSNPDEPYPRFQLTLGGGGFWEEPHVVAGPLVVFANDVTRTNTAELGKKHHHQVERELALNLTAYVEPGLRVLAVSQQVALKSATDDRGRSLKPTGSPSVEDSDDSGRPPQAGVYTWSLSVDLDCPPAPIKQIASLVGVLNVRIQTDADRLELDDVLVSRNVKRTVAGVPFTLKSVKQIGDEYHLAFAMSRERTSPAHWRDLLHSAYQGQMILYDSKGRVVCGRASEQGGDYGSNKIDATLRFAREPGITDPKAGEPYKLVWLAPSQSRLLPVEFKLTNLPIPQ